MNERTVQLPLHGIEVKKRLDLGIYNYILHYIDPLREKGEAKFSFTHFNSGDTWDPASLDEWLIDELDRFGLRDGMPGIRVHMFYPNGSEYLNDFGEASRKRYEHMRQGMGTILLTTIMRDALELGAGFIFMEATEMEMNNFLRKKGFERIGYAHTYYKMLTD